MPERAGLLRESAATGPKLDGVVAVKRLIESNDRLGALHTGDTADEYAAIVRARIAHHVVAALAGQICGREAAAERLGKHRFLRGRHFESVRIGGGTVERLPIDAGHQCDVLGTLHASLDLEGREARTNQCRQFGNPCKIARGKEMRTSGSLAGRTFLIEKFVLKTARLRAQTPIRGAPADR
jgi:hypothetical protein